MKINQIIEKYALEPHIEGGFFREDFRSEIMIETNRGKRSLLTTCYYLLRNTDRSIFHRLYSDEIWHHSSGGSVNLYEIDEQGLLTCNTIGPDLNRGHLCKYLVKKGSWFGALPCKETDYAFLACSVFPGFEFTDWEKADPDHLKRICPKATEIIEDLT